MGMAVAVIADLRTGGDEFAQPVPAQVIMITLVDRLGADEDRKGPAVFFQ